MQRKDIPLFIETIGHVEPILSAHITARVEGALTGVYFQEGKEVKEGDLLFTLDPRPFQAKLEKAKALLEENKASLRLAQEKVERYQSLVNEDYISQLSFEELITQVEKLQAAIHQNEADIQEAKVNLAYCWIYAPFTGKTGILQVDPGNLVSDPSTSLVVINQISPIYVTFSISEKELSPVRAFQKLSPLKVIALPEIPSSTWEGTLQMIDNQIDPETGMIKLRALFPNQEEALWPYQFVRIRLLVREEKQALVVPSSALLQNQQGFYVFTFDPSKNTVEMKNLQIGVQEEGFTTIHKGLKEGEQVVTEGQINLFPHAPVVIAP